MRDVWQKEQQDVITFVQTMIQAGHQASQQPLNEAVTILHEYVYQLQSSIGLDNADCAMLIFAAQLAWSPRKNQAFDLLPLREAGFSDSEIHDITHVICCFSYMNRLADSLGVTSPAQHKEWAEMLFGLGSFEKHLRWARIPHS